MEQTLRELSLVEFRLQRFRVGRQLSQDSEEALSMVMDRLSRRISDLRMHLSSPITHGYAKFIRFF